MRIVKIRSIADNALLESSDVTASTEGEYKDSSPFSVNDIVKVSYESNGTTLRYPVEEYKSLTGVDNYPPDNAVTDWELIGATNKWAMFDEFVNTQTEQTTSMEVEVDSSNTNTVGLFRLQASSITLTQIVNDELLTDGTATTDSFTYEATEWSHGTGQYDCNGTQTTTSKLYQTVTLTEDKYYQVQFTTSGRTVGSIAGYVGGTAGTYVTGNTSYTQIILAGSTNEAGVIADADFDGSIEIVSVKKVPSYEVINLVTMPDSGWYYYLYEDAIYRNKILWDYTQYSDSTLRVKIEYTTGSTAKCGLMAIGSSASLGKSEFGANIGFTDYSVKATDVLGRTYLNQGSYANRTELEGWIYNSQIDSILQAIIDVRGEPVILDANNVNLTGETDYDSLIIYGFFQEPMITIAGPTTSKISIDYEGLI